MVVIKTFILEARDKGLSDTQIKDALKANGWDHAIIDAALLGLDVPQAGSPVTPVSTSASSSTHTSKQSSLSPLMAALHHVLLWFFTGFSMITIIGVVASLSGYDVSSQVLASMIAVTLITFTPYAVLFVRFLLQARREPGLIPGKVWSIITVCLHSIGAMGAAITVVIAAIVSQDSNVITSALLILVLNLIMVTTYCMATFSPLRLARVRKIVLLAHLPVLFLLFGTLFIMSLLQLGPAKHDEQLRKDMVQTVTNVREYITAHQAIPSNSTGIAVGSDVTYVPGTNNQYEVCGEFQTGNRGYESYASYQDTSQPSRDDYVYAEQFNAQSSGHHCFKLQASSLSPKPGQLDANRSYNY